MMKKYNVIDLFSGCGGLSLGFEMESYNVLLGIDNWKDALITFKNNHSNSETLHADLSEIKPSFVESQYSLRNKIDIIIGGPPCQGFSIAGKRDVNDKRNGLYKSFVNFVSYFKPKAFLLENVPNIMSMGNGLVCENIIHEFSRLGYSVSQKILLASDYGVPQNRRRAFFVGILGNTLFTFPDILTLKKITAEEAISDLPEYSVVDGTEYVEKSRSFYQKNMRMGSKGIYNHQVTNHAQKTIDIISLVPDGGNYKSLPKSLQDTRKVNIAWTRLNSQKPSFTIDTGHRHHFHYKYNRIPTVREAARIQSFPDSFIFYGSMTSQNKQVGNAVPPLLGKVIAAQLKKYLT